MEIKQTLILDAGESMSKALDGVLRYGTAVIITKNGQVFGIIDDKNISTGITDASRTKCETVCIKAPLLTKASSLTDQLNAFLSGHFKAIPVVDDKGKPVGVTTRVGLLQELINNRLVPSVRVAEFMKSPVYTIDFNSTVADAKTKMKEFDSHHLVVVDKNRPVGVVSTFDLATYLTKPKGRKDDTRMRQEIKGAESQKIADIVRDSIVSSEQDAPLSDAINKMVEKQSSTILLTDNKKPVGVFTAFDLFKQLLAVGQAAQKPAINISGLTESTLQYRADVVSAIEAAIKKLGKSLNITTVNLHIKEGKSTYLLKAFVEFDGKYESIYAESYSLMETTNLLADEIYTVLHKKKDVLSYKKGKKRFEE